MTQCHHRFYAVSKQLIEQFIVKQGYSLISPVLVTNAEEHREVRVSGKKQVKAGEVIYQLKEAEL